MEQYQGVHTRGSSHGQTRAIRQAYFEDPAYVPLLRRAYQLWAALEAEVSRQLFFRVGLLEIGRPDGPLIGGVMRSAQEHELQIEVLDADRQAADFAPFLAPPETVAVWEPNAGYLLVEECVRAHLETASRYGAELQFETAVRQWDYRPDSVRVRTSADVFEAKGLIVTAGPWAPLWLDELPLQVLRKHVYWFPGHTPCFAANCPVYLVELPHGLFYGFPAVNDQGIKVGEHTGGVPVSHAADDTEDADDLEDAQRVREFVATCLQGVVPQIGERSTCWYTMSSNGHFRINRHPKSRKVLYAAGLSGHGFKFAPVLAEILADLALEGTTRHPIEPFS